MLLNLLFVADACMALTFAPVNIQYKSHRLWSSDTPGHRWMGPQHSYLEGLSENVNMQKDEFEKSLIDQREEFLSLNEEAKMAIKAKEKELVSSEPPSARIEVDDVIKAESYGFVSRTEAGRLNEGTQNELTEGSTPFYQPPPNVVTLALRAFGRNFKAMFDKYDHEARQQTDREMELQGMLTSLQLNMTEIWARERETENSSPFETPLVLRAPYYLLCALLDVASAGGNVPSRLFMLEQIGRAPYISFMTMLNLYETMGWWRPSKNVELAHASEAYNKFHHSKMIEQLGGDQEWIVRCVTEHAALFTHVAVISLWFISPSLAYRFAAMLESHAFHTYSQLIEDNENLLRMLPIPPAVADDLSDSIPSPDDSALEDSVFLDAQHTRVKESLSGMMQDLNSLFPQTLLDVFQSVQDNTLNHVLTLHDCYDADTVDHASSIEKKLFAGSAVAFVLGQFIPAELSDAIGLSEGLI